MVVVRKASTGFVSSQNSINLPFRHEAATRLRKPFATAVMVIVVLITCQPAPLVAADADGSVGTAIMNYDRLGDPVGGVRHTSGPTDRIGNKNGASKQNLRGTGLRPGAAVGRSFTGASGLPPHETGEILAAGLDVRALRRTRTLGYAALEQVRLDALGLSVWRLGIPASSTTSDALTAFRQALPSAVSDFNGLVFTSATSDYVNESARVIGWRHMSQSCGAGLRIGMIDSPVDVSHIALRKGRIEHVSFVPADRQSAPPIHGTAIAALLVGDPAVAGLGGLIPGASLFAANIFEQRQGLGTVGNLMAFLKALDWMVRQKVSVLNMSLETVQNRLMRAGLDLAHRRGIVMAAAAGNGGSHAAPAYPAAHPEVLAVTAISTRFRPFQQANHGSYIDFSAPGVHLWTASPGGGGRYQSGTSLAVPFVTAVAALRLAAGLQPSAALIRSDLIPKARDLGAPGKDDIYGWGLIRFEPQC